MVATAVIVAAAVVTAVALLLLLLLSLLPGVGAIAVVTFVLLEAQVAAAAVGAVVEAAHRATPFLYPIPHLYSLILHASSCHDHIGVLVLSMVIDTTIQRL